MGLGWEFSQWLGGALALGVAVSAWQAHRLDVARGVWADALLSLLAGGALGARAGGLLLGGAGNLSAPWQAIAHAPLSGQGAVVGAVVVLGLWGRRRGDAWAVADALMPGVLAGVALLWLGAFQVGIAYGQPYVGSGALVAADFHGLMMPRWPVQAVGAALSLTLALLLALLPRRALPDGVGCLMGGWGLLVLLFGLGFWQAAPTLILGLFRVEQLGYLVALTLVALALPQRWRQGAG